MEKETGAGRRLGAELRMMNVMALANGLCIFMYASFWRPADGGNHVSVAAKWVILGVGLLFYGVSIVFNLLALRKKYRGDDEFTKATANKSAYITLIATVFFVVCYMLAALIFSLYHTTFIFDENDVSTAYFSADHVAIMFGGAVLVLLLAFFTYALSVFILRARGNMGDYAK